jgi:UDP-N-acetylglucosamine 2-epimerase (non-hydrolysing)
MKMAPLVRAFGRQRSLPEVVLVHTGQHYDVAMNERLFADLELPTPDVNLDRLRHPRGANAEICGAEPVLDEIKPSCIVVVGDVNSTLAVSLVAIKGNTGRPRGGGATQA